VGEAAEAPQYPIEKAVENVVTALGVKCPEGWEKPALVAHGRVEPRGWPPGEGWHIRARQIKSQSDPGQKPTGYVDLWLMPADYARQGPNDLGKKMGTWAPETTTWPYGRAFYRGDGGSEWGYWERDVTMALLTSTPGGKLRWTRVERAQEFPAGRFGGTWSPNVLNRATGPYLEFVDSNRRFGFSVFPFPLDERGRKIIAEHCMELPYRVIAAGDEFVLVGSEGLDLPEAQQASNAISQALGLRPVAEKVVAGGKAGKLRASITGFLLSLARFDESGKAVASLILQVRPWPRPPADALAAQVTAEEAEKIIDLLASRQGLLDFAVGRGYGMAGRTNIPQVTMQAMIIPEGGQPVWDSWHLRLGWSSATWADLKAIRAVLEGPAADAMDKFLAGFGELPQQWQREREAIAAVAPEVRQAVEQMVWPGSPQMYWPMLPRPTIEVYQGVAAELKVDGIRAAYLKLSGDVLAAETAAAELVRLKAPWCLASGLCNKDFRAQMASARGLAALKDLRPAAFTLSVARGYAACGEALMRSLELSPYPMLLGVLAEALDGMLGTASGVKTFSQGNRGERPLISAADFGRAIAVWEAALAARSAKPAADEKLVPAEK